MLSRATVKMFLGTKMSGEEEKIPGDTSQVFLEHLEGTGFFQQIKDLEKNLRAIAEDLQTLGKTATQRLEETESLAAHVLAVEAILAVMLKANPVETGEVEAMVKDKTAGLTDSPEGSPAVQTIAADILSEARD